MDCASKDEHSAGQVPVVNAAYAPPVVSSAPRAAAWADGPPVVPPPVGSPPVDEEPFPLRAVSLAFLLRIRGEIDPTWAARDVKKKFVLPRTMAEKVQCSHPTFMRVLFRLVWRAQSACFYFSLLTSFCPVNDEMNFRWRL
jgi:hypothetical protein